ncbi:hypothetical protein MMC12_007806 [Toensbergia leucococca]|nr:hypothetical protein [Toensbergia leucococca]
MQCGRRMFLAALILASKYLQDRNFSARAWSKISGLGTCEINANEMAFLCAVDWKLHIPEPVFHRWTDVVLKYSQSPQPPSSGNSNSSNIWESIIPTLTPELNELGDISRATTPDSGYDSPSSELDLPSLSASSTSNEQTPTNPYIIPRVLEPRPRETNQCNQILPPLPRLGPLPTPQMTPQTSNFSTPAVSAEGLCPKRPSMCAAMAQVQSACVARTTLDSWKPIAQNPFPPPTRRSSLARSTCSFSSPESMVSDVSSRSSRSSSISSVASATCALPQPRLAVQATRRCANMQLSGPMESSFSQKENSILAIRSSPECERFWERVSASPTRPTDVEQLSQAQFESFFKPPPLPPTSYKTSTQEAAESLRDLALNHHRTLPRPRPTTSRKRERPLSTDLSLQQQVRNLAPLGDIINGRRSEDDGTVLSDSRLADSFLVPKHCGREDLSSSDPSGLPITPPLGNLVSSGWMLKTALAKESASRKRPCCLKESCNVPERAIVSGPGMWAGII